MVVPFAAGGPTDVVARTLSQAMSGPLKGTLVVENVGGAGGTIGAGKVARAQVTATPCCSITSACRLRRAVSQARLQAAG